MNGGGSPKPSRNSPPRVFIGARRFRIRNILKINIRTAVVVPDASVVGMGLTIVGAYFADGLEFVITHRANWHLVMSLKHVLP